MLSDGMAMQSGLFMRHVDMLRQTRRGVGSNMQATFDCNNYRVPFFDCLVHRVQCKVWNVCVMQWTCGETDRKDDNASQTVIATDEQGVTSEAERWRCK